MDFRNHRNHRNHQLIFRARNNQVTSINLLLKTPLRSFTVLRVILWTRNRHHEPTRLLFPTPLWELVFIFRARNNQITSINLPLKTPLRELVFIFRARNNQITSINLLLKTPLRSLTVLRVILWTRNRQLVPTSLLFPTHVGEWIEHPITIEAVSIWWTWNRVR